MGKTRPVDLRAFTAAIYNKFSTGVDKVLIIGVVD
jgi:hypothetical protein